ncbi:unnamed protein product, partial [Rotaria sordida]
DLSSPSMYETSIAMSDLSCFINSDLARDLTNDITTLMTSTKPYILLVPISSDLPNNNASIQLCVQKLQILIEDSARNLKYIGLLAMSTILHTHTKSIQSHSDLIMRCLDLLSRMDLNSPSMYETGIAMNDLSCFINSDLARDLANEIMTLMTSTKPYILLFDDVLNPIAAKAQRFWIWMGLFYDDNGENSNSNSYSGDTLSYQRSKKYIEPTAEELEKQRESKKQSKQMNPFYLKDSKKKPKLTQISF